MVMFRYVNLYVGSAVHCLYNVQRVKILFNKKDTALIQMAEPQQALLAINHLDKTKLWGKVIRVMHSKHTTVQVLLSAFSFRLSICIYFSCQKMVSQTLA
jgi:hypothetical protein